MRPVVISLLSGALLLGASSPVLAVDPNIGRCLKTFDVGPTELETLSTKPSKLCSLDCLATAAEGWAAAWDSPESTATTSPATATRHGQATVKAEKGAATAGDSTGTGETARYTDFGLIIEASGCRATGTWQD